MSRYSPRLAAAVLIVAGVLQGCSGGASGTVPRSGFGAPPTSAPTAAPTSTPTVVPAAFPTAQQRGTVTLPAGVNAPLSSLTVVNSLGSTPVGSNGTFSLTAYSDGPQLTTVVDKKGSVLLMGFLSPSSTVLDVNSTADAMVFFATASFALTSDLRDEMIALIPSAPGIGGLASAIASALAANPDAFAATNSSVASQLQAVVSSLVHSSTPGAARRYGGATRRSHSVLINPLQPASGLTPLSDFPNGFHFQNTLRRPADLYIDRVSFVDAQGNTHPAPLSLTPAAPLSIPPTVGVSTTISTLLNIVEGKYAYAPVDTVSTALPLVANSKSTLYQLTTVGPGLHEGAIGQVTAEEKQDQEDLSVEFLLKDMVLPLVLAFVIPGHDIDHALGVNGSGFVIHDLVHAAEAVPGVAQAAENGDWAQALELLLAQLNNSQSAFAAAVQAALDGILENHGIIAQQQAFKLADHILNAVHAADRVLTAFDASVTEAGLLSSDEADIWTVTVVADQVKLSPSSATIDNNASQFLIAAVPSASGTSTAFAYTWTNTATAGHIFDGITGHEDNFTSANNTVTYVANASGSGTDTITVSVAEIAGQNRLPIGSAQSKITVKPSGLPSISLEPSGCVQFGFGGGSQTYSVTVTNPPPGVTLEFGFAIASTHGTLSDPGATLNQQTHQLVGPSASATLNIPDVEPSPTPGTGFNGGILADLWFVTPSGQLSNTFPGGKLVEASALWGYGDVNCNGTIRQ